MTQFHINFSDYLLCFHEGNITYLSPVSSNCFTTGAADGTLILWSINSLNAIKKFGLHSDDLSHSLSLTLSTTSLTNDKTVGRVMILCEKFIFAAVGNGFKVFDVFSSDRSGPAQSSHEIQSFYKPLMSHVNAHSDVVIDMEFVFESCMLLTASADHTVRLWRSCLQTPHNNKLDVTTDDNAMKLSVETFLGLQDGNQTNRGKRKSQTIPMVPMLLGELTLHSDTVEKVRYLGKEFGIVTCGADGVVLIWKNLELEIKKKDSELTYQETYYDTL
jgi:WD40 repeat protein